MKTDSRLQFMIRALLLVAVLGVTGCKEVLYSDLSEIEANEMVSILDAGGISAGRERSKDGVYTIKVDGALVASAVTLLQSAGYPKQRFQSLGDVFAGDGLVGSAFDERARFMHALNEELAHTIGDIDGVRSARVQVIIPAEDKYNPSPKQARASVAVTHDEKWDLTTLVPVIKTLVVHSVPDLAYDNVAVALFPVQGPQVPGGAVAGGAPQTTRAMSVMFFDLPPVWTGVILGALASSAGLLLRTLLRRFRSDEATDGGLDA